MTLRKTKIVATLGPASSDEAVIESLVEAGVDVVRLNFSHGSAADHIARAEVVRDICRRSDRPKLARRISTWSQIARRDGVLLLENHMYSEQDPFVKTALRLVIDGTPPEKIRDICNVDINRYESAQRNAVKIWEAAGGYAPTVGILGAVLGLIHVMENLSDPARLGSGIAVAFVATIYGVGFANLLFLPVANKLKALVQLQTTRREMVVEGVVGIANGENHKIIEERLNAYLR